MSAIKVVEKNMTDDKFNAYEKAVRQVWADGQVSLDEADMIEALRKSLNISLEEHAEIESKIRREYDQSIKEGKNFSLEAKGVHEPSETPEPAAKAAPAGSTPPAVPETSTGEGGDGEIGVSPEELSNDLDVLSKSIGQLGEKIFGGESLSDRIQKEAGDVLEDETGEAADETPAEDSGASEIKGDTGSELLSELKSQYELGPDEGAPGGGTEPVDDEKEQAPMEESPLDDETLEEYLEAGKEAFREKDYKRAVSFLKKGLKIEPDNKEVKFFLKKVATAIKSMKGSLPEPTVKAPPEENIEEVPAPTVEEAPPPEPRVDAGTGDSPAVAEATGPDANCSSCGGSGICNWCKGAVKCYWCNGTGKCTKCKGAKEIDGKPCGFCNSEGICGSCEGTGHCTWCKGTGKCSNCSM